MRLTEHEVSAIKQAAREAFGDDAVVRLFGSRVHDDLRGGDIDLLVRALSMGKLHHAIPGTGAVAVAVQAKARPNTPIPKIPARPGPAGAAARAG